MDREGLAVVPEAMSADVGSRPSSGSLRALRSRPFRLYFGGQVASASGTFLQQTATGWLVLQLTGSAATLGLVLAAGGVPHSYGLMSTVLSVGSVVGSLAVGVVRHPRRTYLVAATAGFGICLAGTAVSPTVPVACVALVLTGATGFAFATLASTTLQLHSAPAYRGRIVALWVFVFLGTTPIGSLLTGGISSAAGPRAALAVGAAACLVAAGIGLRVPAVETGESFDGFLGCRVTGTVRACRNSTTSSSHSCPRRGVPRGSYARSGEPGGW